MRHSGHVMLASSLPNCGHDVSLTLRYWDTQGWPHQERPDAARLFSSEGRIFRLVSRPNNSFTRFVAAKKFKVTLLAFRIPDPNSRSMKPHGGNVLVSQTHPAANKSTTASSIGIVASAEQKRHLTVGVGWPCRCWLSLILFAMSVPFPGYCWS